MELRFPAALLVALISLLPETAGAVGLEVNTRFGYGSAGSESPIRYEGGAANVVRPSLAPAPDAVWDGREAPYGGGLIMQGGLGFRTGKFVSVGLGGGIRSASADSSSVQDLKRSAWNAGPWVRVYLPMVPIVDPYIGLGVEYVNDRQTYKAPVRTNQGNLMVDWTLEHHGIGVPITLGVDYTFAKVFSIGPSFQYMLVFPAGGCQKINAMNIVSDSNCASEAENRRIVGAKGYGVWSLGLSLRLTVPPM